MYVYDRGRPDCILRRTEIVRLEVGVRRGNFPAEKEEHVKMKPIGWPASTMEARASSPTRLGRVLLSLLPLGIIVGLICAALFIKPVVTGQGVPRPVIEKRDRFYGVAMTAPDSLWAVGNDGKIVLSSDGGKQWAAQSSGTTTHLQAIAAWNANQAVVVGNRGTLLHTGDGGKTWRKGEAPAAQLPPKLIKVRAAGAGVAWAVGEMGTVLVTADFGKTWKPAPTKIEDMSWNDIGFAGSRGCMVGEFGRIRCTVDRGASWKDVEPPVKSSLNGIAFRNETEAVAVGLEGVVLHTSDGGTNWRLLTKVTELHLYDVTWDGSRWVAVGDRGVTLVADAGATQWSDLTKVVDSPSWHTQVTGTAGQLALAGQGIKLVRLDGKDK
jgi:photosystem II stability/assembly factor-like uncharacterized protein